MQSMFSFMRVQTLDKTPSLSTILINSSLGVVAQLVRVPPCHGGCRGFESRQPRMIFYQITLKQFSFFVFSIVMLYQRFFARETVEGVTWRLLETKCLLGEASSRIPFEKRRRRLRIYGKKQTLVLPQRLSHVLGMRRPFLLNLILRQGSVFSFYPEGALTCKPLIRFFRTLLIVRVTRRVI